MDDLDHTWEAETEHHPFFLMHRGDDMVAAYREYWERQRDDEDIFGGGLPEVWE